jgi:hypothetical protein
MMIVAHLRGRGGLDMRTVKLVLALAILLGVGGLAVAQDSGEKELSESLAYATWMATKDNTRIVVGTHVMALEHKEKYLPVQVAVGRYGKGGGHELTITPDQFVMVDAKGTVYRTVPYADMKKERGLLRHVQQMCRGPLKLDIGDAFPGFKMVGSILYPVQGQEWSWVSIASGNFMADVIYFPNPGDEALDAPFTVGVYDADMKPLVAATVELVGKHNKHDHD